MIKNVHRDLAADFEELEELLYYVLTVYGVNVLRQTEVQDQPLFPYIKI
jgi:hypothetical protein